MDPKEAAEELKTQLLRHDRVYIREGSTGDILIVHNVRYDTEMGAVVVEVDTGDSEGP